ncbi:hypothetical protein EW145_g4863 [Phellinidium pouzarii]|uniref:Peroxidase n=1 Tax=Phellinidium pouzarii TaxID=167371 RepID=A0A4S4L200_9AGAM|nr:hypothetical protein EW145_g4863 [Phellinidium pouzarii]
MSMLAAIRAPARRAAFVAAPRTTARSTMRASFRKYSTESTEPAKKSSNTLLYASLGGVALAGVGYYFYTSSSESSKQVGTAAKSAAQSVKVLANFVPTKEDYQKVYNEIAGILEENSEYDDGSYGPILIRLAWHSSGTYDKDTKTGGSNYATMRFEPEALHGVNRGLNIARSLQEKVKQKFPWISYGDLWTLGGVVAVQEMAGPKILWRPGRIDGYAKDATPDGRLPDASQGADHLRNVFYRMGFNDQEIVALSGAHALGRGHTDRSGFEGPWTFSPTTFTNNFYTLLLEEKWVWRKWGGPKQLQDKKTQSLMMMPTDYALTTDKNFKKYVKAYAEDQDLFFKDFSKAFSKVLELGVPVTQWVTSEPWILKTTEEQESK